MEANEKDALKKMFEEMLNVQTAALSKEIQEVKKTLDPIAAIYLEAKGFGAIMKFIFKAIIVPLSVFVGIVLSLREVIKNMIH